MLPMCILKRNYRRDLGLRDAGVSETDTNLTYLAGPCEQGIATSNLNSSLTC
jgi:hypothetical protein